MLAELAIDDLVLIAEARLALSPGLNVITGETGAGKSLLAQAIGLLLGDKADESLVRQGASRALVQAVFESGAGSRAGKGAGASRELAVSRQVPREGRSRVYVDGVVSSAAAVEAALRDRVAFYGQLEHAKLLQLDRQLDLLDAAAPATIGPLLASYGEAYAAAQRHERELEALRGRGRDRDRELDLLRFQIGELEAAALEPGEDERVAQERERLRHAEKLIERVSDALRMLSAGDDGGAVDGLRVAERLVSEAAGHDQELVEVAGRLASLSAEADDALSVLQAYLEGLDLDPAHRDAVELRYDTLQTLKRKYRLAASDELLAYLDEARQRLATLETAEHDEGELTKILAQARAAALAAATELSAARAAAAPGFAAAVERELRELAMPHARFEVKLVPRGPKAGAADDVGDAERAGAVSAESGAGDASGASRAPLSARTAPTRWSSSSRPTRASRCARCATRPRAASSRAPCWPSEAR